MIEIRWLVRGGERCLQYRHQDVVAGELMGWTEWQDVPAVGTAEGEQIDK